MHRYVSISPVTARDLCIFFCFNKLFSFTLFTSWRLLINSIIKCKVRKAFENRNKKTPGCRRESVVFLQHCFVYIFPLHNRKMPDGKKVTENSRIIFNLRSEFRESSICQYAHRPYQPLRFRNSASEFFARSQERFWIHLEPIRR